MRLRTLLRSPRGFVIGLRLGLFTMLAVVLVLLVGFDVAWPPLGLLLAIVAGATLATARSIARIGPAIEIGAAALLIGLNEPSGATLMPYLIAPAVAAGLLWGASVASVSVGLALGVLALTAVVVEADPRSFSAYAGQWLVLSLIAGLLAAWARRLRVESQSDPSQASYQAAYRLLSQLRTVSRQLAGGLDAYSLAQATLENLQRSVAYSRAALFARSEGGLLVPLAFGSAMPVDWHPSIDADSLWAEAWTSGSPSRGQGLFSGGEDGYAAALPLRVGVRVIGILGVERLDEPFTSEELAAAETLLADASLRIETALLFSEVRQIATAEERRRLAREIHDGIAQELASLGYVMDDMAYRAATEEQRQALQSLRSDLTRIISELRLSIFDLRSEVHTSTGLGAALSDYVRTIGATSDLTVHLILDESPHRLRAETEAELLRIAQESITNVRKHARSANLWVTCQTNPPNAFLRIEDDGLGLGPSRTDSYGMEIMRERARRLGADLTVRPRDGGGTVVEVVVGELAPDSPNGLGHAGGDHVHDRAAR
ncbi:MAG TPA: histidine kinase [Actinomycetes bacterium]